MLTFEINVLCDGKGCSEFITAEPTRIADAKAAVRQAQAEGFVVTRRGHDGRPLEILCRTCAKAAKKGGA